MLCYGISVSILRATGFDIIEILRDPAQQTGQSSFLGFISNIGVWLLVSSTAICFFTISIKELIVNSQHKNLLFLIAILSLILAVDDFFLIHDRYINEIICYLFYAVYGITLLRRHYKIIRKINFTAFILAVSFLALSILTDLIQSYVPLSYEYSQLFEEGFKFIGLATWLYFTSCVASSVSLASSQEENNF